MRQKIALFLLLSLALPAPDILAGQDKSEKSKDKPDTRSSEKMPVYGVDVHQTPGYGQAKKAIEEAEKGPSLKEKLSRVVEVVKALPQRGDPKTDYQKSENRKHAKEKDRAKGKKTRTAVHADEPDTSDITITDTGAVQANYTYEEPTPTNPYTQVIVVYDPVSLEPVSAEGIITTPTDETADLSGMTLVSTGYRSDGTTAYEVYQTAPDSSGATTSVIFRYEPDGSISSVTQTYSQPLDLATTQLPPLV